MAPYRLIFAVYYSGYLFAVFAIVGAVFFGYALLLLNSQGKLRWEIDSLKKAFKENVKEL